jgi:ABC-2 type transport system permease protein
MRTIGILIRKEFLQLLRNKAILPILFVMPVVQLLILSFAADFEIKNMAFYWVDHDQSTTSQRLLQKINASPYFTLTGSSFDLSDAEEALETNQTDLILVIPAGLEKTLVRENHEEIQLLVNAINGTKAGLGSYYMQNIIMDFSMEWLEDYGLRIRDLSGNQTTYKQIVADYSFWFNPNLDYKTFMVPGILVLLVTMIGGFVSSMNIVREKELGTIEQLNVTPIRKYQFIAGKLIPLWIIGLIELAIGLTIAKLVFNTPILGNLGVLFAFAGLYLIMVLGMGMFISTTTETQQQAMFISWFFLVIFILMSGLFTPIENMPDWAQKITLINPIRYFIEVIRLLLLKGATFLDLSRQFAIVSIYAIIINALAVWKYRKTV